MSDEQVDGATKVRSYRDLLVWRKAMEIVDAVYRISAKFPSFEEYGLRSQITRAAVSVVANIAEGQARASSKDFAKFLVTARSSLIETEALLLVALRQGYIGEEAATEVSARIDETSRMLTSLRTAILRRARKG